MRQWVCTAAADDDDSTPHTLAREENVSIAKKMRWCFSRSRLSTDEVINVNTRCARCESSLMGERNEMFFTRRSIELLMSVNLFSHYFAGLHHQVRWTEKIWELLMKFEICIARDFDQKSSFRRSAARALGPIVKRLNTANRMKWSESLAKFVYVVECCCLFCLLHTAYAEIVDVSLATVRIQAHLLAGRQLAHRREFSLRYISVGCRKPSS